MKKLKKRLVVFVLMLCAMTIVSAQNSIIQGQVVDSTGEPLIGANVSIVGSKVGVNTDTKGFYRLDVKKGSILEISYIVSLLSTKNLDD